jgi:hypothetical protein
MNVEPFEGEQPSRDRKEAQRVRRAPPNGPGTSPRRAPFCAKFLRSAERVALVPHSWYRFLQIAPRLSLRCYMLSIFKSRPLNKDSQNIRIPE